MIISEPTRRTSALWGETPTLPTAEISEVISQAEAVT